MISFHTNRTRPKDHPQLHPSALCRGWRWSDGVQQGEMGCWFCRNDNLSFRKFLQWVAGPTGGIALKNVKSFQLWTLVGNSGKEERFHYRDMLLKYSQAGATPGTFTAGQGTTSSWQRWG